MLQLTIFALQQPGKQNNQHHGRVHCNLTTDHLHKNFQIFTDIIAFITVKVKVKQSLYRPELA
jgi:hypothetical protein